MATVEYTDITELGDDLLTCKALWAHDWGKNPSPKQIDGMLARMATWIVCLRCKRCRRERYTYLDSTGRKMGPHYYRNPVGYPKTRRMDNDALWAEMAARSLLVQTYNGTNGT
jgi:hypothetical protein